MVSIFTVKIGARMCRLFWSYWYGFTHCFEKIDTIDMRIYVKLKCYKER